MNSISSKKSESLIKESQEFYDATSAVVCQKSHRDIALFLLRKNTKFSKTREAVKKYPAKLSFLENSYRKETEKEKNVSMKSPSKYYNTIEMDDDIPDSNLCSVRKYTKSGFDPDLN